MPGSGLTWRDWRGRGAAHDGGACTWHRGMSSRREFGGVYNTIQPEVVFSVSSVVTDGTDANGERWIVVCRGICRKAELQDPGIAFDVNSWSFPIALG